MIYTVKTQTSLETFSSNNVAVQRRFRDFRLMRELLTERNRGIVVPPLPSASLMTKYMQNDAKVEERRRALETFLNRVAAHPQLKRAPEF